MRYFYSGQEAGLGETVTIDGSDAAHIRNVLRLKAGDTVGLLDGQGFEYEARIRKLSSRQIHLTVLHVQASMRESPVKITLAQGMLKEKKMDGIVRQLTELGIFAWVPFTAERSVARPDENTITRRMRRWNKIAQETIKQCRRGRLMKISVLQTFGEVLEMGQRYELKFIFWEAEKKRIPREISLSSGHADQILLMLGPEGGFSKEEVRLARAGGFIPVSLGPRILRAETAAVTASALVQYLYGDMGCE